MTGCGSDIVALFQLLLLLAAGLMLMADRKW